MHQCDCVHRDIKPDNFLVGIYSSKNLVFLIDFGLSRWYRKRTYSIKITGRDPDWDPPPGPPDPVLVEKGDLEMVHNPLRHGNGLVGTALYCSVNAHAGTELSRRDDLISIGYVLLFCCRGTLPWASQEKTKQNPNQDKNALKQQLFEFVHKEKARLTPEELCDKGCPKGF